MALNAQAIAKLRNPEVSLPLYGTVIGRAGKTGYDPSALTTAMQIEILSYMAEPPRMEDGKSKWLVLVGSRQGGKSTAVDIAGYPLAMYNPGWYHVTISDKNDRAEYLHSRIQFNHKYWPDELKVDQQNSRETRKLEFVHGGGMHVLSGHSHAVGVGTAPDCLHLSEVPLMPEGEKQWSMLWPAIQYKVDARVVLESTPYLASEPSTEFFKDIYYSGKRGDGRLTSQFYPFWDVKGAVERWRPEWSMTNEEIRLLERYGRYGLTKENLAFRRSTMNIDPQIRRNPELFGVFFPFDDLSCWLGSGGGMIPYSALQKHEEATCFNEDYDSPYHEFEEPLNDCQYVIGVDPAGYGRDHFAFQVLKVWDDEWEQVAVFGDNCDSLVFQDKLLLTGLRYNKAKIIVERNGVGQSVVDFLRRKKYTNLHYDKAYKPGIHTGSHDKMLAVLIDALLDKLKLNDRDTVAQLKSYRGDKAIERQPKALILSGDPVEGGKRRPRHHWDKVSSLATACIGARAMPIRIKPRLVTPTIGEVLTVAGWENYVRQVKLDEKRKRKNGRRR